MTEHNQVERYGTISGDKTGYSVVKMECIDTNGSTTTYNQLIRHKTAQSIESDEYLLVRGRDDKKLTLPNDPDQLKELGSLLLGMGNGGTSEPTKKPK